MKAISWLLILNWAYVALLALLTFMNWLGPDRFWLGALNFYLPQSMWALPGVFLLIFTIKMDRPWTWLPLISLLWVLGPIMGFTWSPQRGKAEASGGPLRVMTWNIKYGKHDLMPLVEELERSRPDIVLFQDAVHVGKGPLMDYFSGWQVRVSGQYLVASRYPITAAETHELPYLGKKKEFLLHCRVLVGRREISVYNVHLKTPRRSLNAFRGARKSAWYIPKAIQRFENNIGTRLEQAESVATFLGREKGDVIVAGDLNSPDHSQVCDLLRSAGLKNAFTESGRGYGYTYGHFLLKNRIPWVRVSWMRIDHIWASRGLVPLRTWVGTCRASDHRPVLADFIVSDSGTL